MRFELIPFPSEPLPKVKITGEIERTDNQLSVRYRLRGDLENIIIPAHSASLSRKDELWKTTCFEILLAIKGQLQYWEFNMSPSGDWNVYHMDAYRRVGFREETSIQQLQFEGLKGAGTFTLNAEVDLHPILQAGQLLEVAITAIIQTRDGNETYWALSHPASSPDFHLREGFVIELAPS